jgi:hypothetical protein
MDKKNKFCRVCGFEMIEPPWGEDGCSPSWDICPCCGTEFGYEDCNLESVRKIREKWIVAGKKWFDLKKRPEKWNFDEQFANIPKDFL